MNYCKCCGKETKNKTYCSLECKSKAMSKPKGKCLNCGKELNRCETKYCSKICYQKYKKKKYEESLVYNKCIICGKSTLNEKYCSMTCMGKDENRKTIAINNLKNEHIWSNEEILFLNENYGILDINAIEKHLNIKKESIIAYASKHNIKSQRKWTKQDVEYLIKNKNENLDILANKLTKSKFAIINKYSKLNKFQDETGYKIISPQEYISNFIKNELKIPFLEEIQIGRYRTDILIYNLDIEIQGTYWHCDKRFFDKEHLSETQKNRIEKDKRKKEYLKEKGIEILYIWEYDLVSNPEKCKEIIINKLKELDIL